MTDKYQKAAAGVPRIADNVLVCRLALERCQQHLAHLHVILHLCLPDQAADDDLVAMASIRKLIASMAQELSYSVDTLGLCD